MENKAFQKSAYVLTRPYTLISILILLVNDHILRWVSPSWWTGKVGDFAWLFFFPFTCAAVFAWIIPSRLKSQEKIVSTISFGLVGLIFIMVNTLPAAYLKFMDLLAELAPFPATYTPDPTDLIALLALIPGYWVWRCSPPLKISRPLHMSFAVAVAAIATIANMGLPSCGVSALSVEHDTLIARVDHLSYVSENGGYDWVGGGIDRGGFCPPDGETILVTTPNNPDLHYQFTTGNPLIEKSENGGQTWGVVYTLDSISEAKSAYYNKNFYLGSRFGPQAGLIDPATGNLILAMGHEGVMILTPTGEANWIQVGEFKHLAFQPVNALPSLLVHETVIAIMVGFLTAGTLSWFANLNWRRGLLLGIVWLFIGTYLWLNDPIGRLSYSSVILSALEIISFAASITIYVTSILTLPSPSPESRKRVGITSVAAAFLFITPFILWVFNLITSYSSAKIAAAALGLLVIVFGLYQSKKSSPEGSGTQSGG